MLKKYVRAALLGVGIFAGLAASVYAWMRPQWAAPVANEQALAYNQTYAANTNNMHIDSLSMQCVYSSATIVNTRFVDSNIALNSAVILATNPYITNGQINTGGKGAIGFQVWLSTSAGVVPAPLKWGTTYYVIPVNTSSFSLAATSTGAVAGLGIVLTSSGTGNLYTLNSTVLAGTPSFKWEVSNDGASWVNMPPNKFGVAVSSVTVSSYVFPSSTTAWDFGDFDWAWVRLNVISPTAGGLAIKCTPNGEGQTSSD